MGLGPSYIPNCSSKHCGPYPYNKNVVYIYHTTGDPPQELDPWFARYVPHESKTTYWACEECYKKIPHNYKEFFRYNSDYKVYGM